MHWNTYHPLQSISCMVYTVNMQDQMLLKHSYEKCEFKYKKSTICINWYGKKLLKCGKHVALCIIENLIFHLQEMAIYFWPVLHNYNSLHPIKHRSFVQLPPSTLSLLYKKYSYYVLNLEARVWPFVFPFICYLWTNNIQKLPFYV